MLTFLATWLNQLLWSRLSLYGGTEDRVEAGTEVILLMLKENVRKLFGLK